MYDFFFGKKKSITVNLDISVSHLSKKKSSTSCFSTAVVVVTCCLRPSGRHDFCQLSIFSVFLKVLLFLFQLMDDHISLKKVFLLCDKGVSRKMV